MTFAVLLHKEAAKTLEKVQPATRRRIIAALERLKTEPFDGKRLHGELEGSLRIRVSDWRIIYDVDQDRMTVVVHVIAARGGAYK